MKKRMPGTGVHETDAVEQRRHLTALLEAARTDLVGEIGAGRGGRAALRRFSGALDDLVRGLYRAVEPQSSSPVLLLALGGYGRRTLCLYSDIDLLILFEKSIRAPEERLLKGLLHPLWDLGLSVGHQVRQLADFGQVERDNPEFQLALLDARPITGELRLFDKWQDVYRRTTLERDGHLLEALLKLVDERHAQFNHTLYQLEPDVKDAPGGLRDLYAVRVIETLASPLAAQRGSIDPVRLEAAEDFLLRVRSLLHLDARRNSNVLTHALQETIAEPLGYRGTRHSQRVEALMSDYFRHARLVAKALARGRKALDAGRHPGQRMGIAGNLELADDGVGFTNPARAAVEPASWVDAFEAALDRGVPVSDEALRCIARHRDRYDVTAFVATAAQRQQLLRLLRPRPGLYARLSDLHGCGLLDRIFPEFRAISCRVTRDFYHKYTVDEHTLLAIRNIERLTDPAPARERLAAVLAELRAPELLVLALLYHDVGKWTEGSHVEESVRMARLMFERLQLDDDARALVEFLIRHHLAMSRAAFRRDSEDPEGVRQLATLVGSEQRLKMLCLLTLADIGAVSPDTLTPWKEELLWRLYVDTYNFMTLGYGDEIIGRDPAGLAELVSGRPPDIDEAEITTFLKGFPRRYLQLFDQESIYRHMRLSRDIQPDEVHLFLQRRADVWELTVVTLDKPFLFSNMSGVLSYFGMNILRGHALTSRHGMVVDVFQFTDQEGFLTLNPEAESYLFRTMQDVVAGRADVPTLLRGKERSLLYLRGPHRIAPLIHFDNDYSARYTVLEIVAQDALGLLYRISRVISQHGCDVDLVLIATEGQKAIDVFHLTRRGAKLPEPDQMALKAAFERMLKEGYEAD